MKILCVLFFVYFSISSRSLLAHMIAYLFPKGEHVFISDPIEHTFLNRVSQCNVCTIAGFVGSSRVDLQACKLEYSIVSPK